MRPIIPAFVPELTGLLIISNPKLRTCPACNISLSKAACDAERTGQARFRVHHNLHRNPACPG
jgi:hypothetical protein